MLIKKRLLSEELDRGAGRRPIYTLRFRMPGETLTLDDLDLLVRRAHSLQASIYREILIQVVSESPEAGDLLKQAPLRSRRNLDEKGERFLIHHEIPFLDESADRAIKSVSGRVPSALPVVEFRRGSFEIATVFRENLPGVLAFLMSSTAFHESAMGKRLNRILLKKIKPEIVLDAVRSVLGRTRLRVQHNNGEESLVVVYPKTVEIELEQ